MPQILECFDLDLLERAQVALREAGIDYRTLGVASGSLAGWQIEVAESDAARGALLVEKIAQDLESARSQMICPACRIGMVVVESSSEAGAEIDVIEYRCPRCGRPGLACAP